MLKKIKPEMAVIYLLSISLLVLIYIAFIKKDAVWLETLKTGGSENFGNVVKLYQSDAYKTQQTTAIEQAMKTFAGSWTQQ